jgi:polyhydroxyalkanoate synthesis regulator phasin
MLNHALSMTVEGYNLVMMGNMDMAKGVDESAVEHGNMMIKNGTSMFTETMSGKTMEGMHHEGKDPMKDPAMAFTHKLAEKQLVVMDLLAKMPKMETGPGMAIHHQHIMLNHALKMALEGANSVMLGDMGMAKGIDDISVKHGKMMLKNARALFDEIMSGETMMKMHQEGTAPESNETMNYTHKLAEAQLQVLTLLDEMPGVK